MGNDSFDPLSSTSSPVIVYLDIKSPYAFIARAPTRALEAELGLRFDWRPLTLNIPSYLGSAKLDKRGKVETARRSRSQWGAVKYAYRDARRYAALQGYPLRGTEKIWDTALIHIAFNWVRTTAPEALDAFLDRVYPPFWQRDLDIEDLALVTQTLRAADVETAGFAAYATGVGREQHDIEQTAIFDAGIYGVPTYVHGGEFWFGRENLAVLRHRLLGNPGPAPDVRYDRLSGRDVETPTLAAQLKPVERIDIYIDLLEAPSYLGLAATVAMLDTTGRQARWLPFRGPAPTARPNESEATADSTVRGVAHRRHRSRYRVASLEAQAAALGCSIERRYSPTSAALFDDALLWVDDQPDAPAVEPFIAACFNAYWEHNADITDADMIRTELIAAGFDGNAWAARLRDGQLDTAAVARIDAALANAEERGTWEGPRFILDDEPYSGRTHLPLVEARLRLVQSETPTQ